MMQGSFAAAWTAKCMTGLTVEPFDCCHTFCLLVRVHVSCSKWGSSDEEEVAVPNIVKSAAVWGE